MILLDGAMGTLLAARGVAIEVPVWSAAAIRSAPEIVSAIHREYAAAGATVHTANTFRTKRRAAPHDWAELAREAVALARAAVPREHRIAGSVAPLEDCYRPELSPRDSRAEHRELIEVLAEAGVDLILCETFPHAGEALVAVEEAVRTGLPTWVSFTAGPYGALMSAAEMGEAARACIGAGAAAVLVNCVAVSRIGKYVEAIRGAGVSFGVYANAGDDWEGFGWGAEGCGAAYADAAREWLTAGASIVGGCCGTEPAHIAALARTPRTED